tara:strand:- start:150 stop:473 length:324 start_codon:yes stop_codon:yes gene_type:complete
MILQKKYTYDIIKKKTIMTKRYAIVDSSNIVKNVIIWDGNTLTWQPPAGTICVALGTDRTAIGMSYNKDGSGVGTDSNSMWIYPETMTFDGSNWDVNGNGMLDMFSE